MYKANLVKSRSAPTKRPLTAHCFPNNSTLNLTKAQKAASPCINGMIYQDVNSPDFLGTDNNFNGASDFDECVRDVRQMFTIEKKCQIGTDFCSFHDVLIADVKPSKFMAVSGFYYNLQNTNKLFNLSLNRDLNQFRKTTSHLCSMSWNQVTTIRREYLGFRLMFLFFFFFKCLSSVIADRAECSEQCRYIGKPPDQHVLRQYLHTGAFV